MYQVPWDRYSEEEIQDVVSYIFQQKNYDVYNIHKVQKNAENGADIECSRSFQSDKILIAVKKKPQKSDIQQLNDLKKRDEINKIYVYINEPSKAFKDEMTDDVMFWNSSKLTTELFNVDVKLYIFLVYENLFETELYNLKDRFIKIKEEVEKSDFKDTQPTFDKKLISILYYAKDRSTSFNKTMRHVQLMQENMINSKLSKKSEEEFVYGYLKLLEEIHYTSIEPLCDILNSLINDYESLIKIWCYQTVGRSNWRFFKSHNPELLPDYLDLNPKNEYPLKRLSKSKTDFMYLLADISRIISFEAYWYEETVDNFFNIIMYGNSYERNDDIIMKLYPDNNTDKYKFLEDI